MRIDQVRPMAPKDVQNALVKDILGRTVWGKRARLKKGIIIGVFMLTMDIMFANSVVERFLIRDIYVEK